MKHYTGWTAAALIALGAGILALTLSLAIRTVLAVFGWSA